MGLRLDELRALAERVAASHGLEIVDLEFQGGGGKHRTLRVFIEKNADERSKLRTRAARLLAERADAEGDPASKSAVAAEAEAGAEPAEGVFADEDEAFLEGLPSVGNLELLSGITHEDCELFSRDFGTLLDVEELVPGTEYLLEVSSPGLDRRLSREADYRRFVGSLAKLQTFEPVQGNRHWQGRIVSAEAATLILDTGDKQATRQKKKGASEAGQGSVAIAFANIEKAVLVPEF